MDQDDQDIPVDGKLQPKQPDEFPPLQPDPMPFATGKDQDAGQALESGQALTPPAPVIREPILYRTESSFSPPPEVESIQYSGHQLTQLHPETATKPAEFPPLPERPDTVRGQGSDSPSRMPQPIGDAQQYRWLNTIEKVASSDKESRGEMIRTLESAADTMSMMTMQLAMQRAIIDDCRTRLMELERWAMTFTIPGVRSSGY